MGDRERARPLGPVVAGAFVEVTGGRADRARQALVRAEDQVERSVEHEGDGVGHVGDGAVGGEAQGLGGRDDAVIPGLRPGDGSDNASPSASAPVTASMDAMLWVEKELAQPVSATSVMGASGQTQAVPDAKP